MDKKLISELLMGYEGREWAGDIKVPLTFVWTIVS